MIGKLNKNEVVTQDFDPFKVQTVMELYSFLGFKSNFDLGLLTSLSKHSQI